MNYQKIDKFSIADGCGIRVVLWVSGCTLRCKGCQNPESWDFNSGMPFNYEAKEYLLELLDRPYIKGLTISGGHAVEQENGNNSIVLKLVKEIKERLPDKDIWLYTGLILSIDDFRKPFGDLTAKNELFKLCDVIVDGEYIEDQRDITLPFRGSRNQRIIDVKKTIEQDKIIELNFE